MRPSRQLAFEPLEEKTLLSPLPLPIALGSPPILAPLSQGLQVTLTTDHRVYRPGQPIVITLTETNSSQHEVNVVEGPSTSGFVSTRNRRRVWASNAGIQPMFVTSQSLQPGQSITLSATWNGLSNLGAGVPVIGRVVIGTQAPGGPHLAILIQRP
jgi:hypothetical protein